jgi:hypothetical protein
MVDYKTFSADKPDTWGPSNGIAGEDPVLVEDRPTITFQSGQVFFIEGPQHSPGKIAALEVVARMGAALITRTRAEEANLRGEQ